MLIGRAMGGHSSKHAEQGPSAEVRASDVSQQSKKAGSREKRGGGPPVFCNCSFQEGLSPLILQVRNAEDLRAHFSHLRIVKDLRKRPCLDAPTPRLSTSDDKLLVRERRHPQRRTPVGLYG